MNVDDLQQKISQILSDPNALEQVKSLGSMLGLAPSGNAGTGQPAIPQPPKKETVSNEMMPPDTIGTITKIMPILSSIKQEDESTRLLSALRPFLSAEKQKKLDEARKMLQLLRVLPMIKGSGLF